MPKRLLVPVLTMAMLVAFGVDDASQWGRLVKSGNRGRTELYELDFGGGYKVITRVTWATRR